MIKTKWLTLLVVVFTVVVLTAPILAHNGGEGVGNQEIGCAGTSKHTTGLAVVSMGGSPMNPQPGQQVTVWVNVSGGATVGRLYGVMIITALSGSSLPSVGGWTIVTDPSGVATNNYYERTATAGQNSFMWTLTAPASGSHTLYSKAYYSGGGTSSATIFTQGITFNVGGGGGSQGNTSVSITNPLAGITVVGTVNINANPVNTAGISYAVLRIDGVVISNLTAAPYGWTWNTAQYADGIHTINVTAAGADGTFGYAQRTVTVSNAAVQTLDQDAWQWTAMALLLSSIAAISLVTVLILMLKKRRMGGGN
jgi:hypothetical protein